MKARLSAKVQNVQNPGTKLVGVAFELRKRFENSSSYAHVLHKTLKLVISRCCFAEDSKEMYQNLKRTLFCDVVVAIAVAFRKTWSGSHLHFYLLFWMCNATGNSFAFIVF